MSHRRYRDSPLSSENEDVSTTPPSNLNNTLYAAAAMHRGLGRHATPSRTSTVYIDSPLPASSPLTALSFSSPVNANLDDLDPDFDPFSEHVLDQEVLNSDPGVDASSPVLERTKAGRAAHRREKAKRKNEANSRLELERRNAMAAAQMDEILNLLASKGVRFGDLLSYVFNPDNGKGDLYYHEFFADNGAASQILDWWTSPKNSKSARTEVRNWAIDHVEKIMVREARKVTKSKLLQTAGKPIDESLVLSFSFSGIHETLTDSLAPVSMQLITSLATSQRVSEHSDHRKERTKMVCGHVIIFWCQ